MPTRYMTTKPFAPKDADTLRAEVLEATNLDYEGNEQQIDSIVELRLKDEAVKASLHEQKEKLKAQVKPADEIVKPAEPVNPGEQTPKNEAFSLKDIRALSDVPDEDVDDVIEFAKFKGISIAEAKNNPVIKTILKTKAEERRTAEATSVTTTRRSSGQSTEEKVLGSFEKGQLPETEEDEAALAKAQFDKLLKGSK